MSKNRVRSTFMNIGASSLLVIFLVLCIAVFATLSLSSARSDYSFSEKMAEHKTDYYNASNTSERILDQIDAALAEAAAGSSGAQDFYAKAAAAIDDPILDVPVDVTWASGAAAPTIAWRVQIDDTQALAVTLAIQWPGAEGIDGSEGTDGYYRIEAWQTVPIDLSQTKIQ